MSVPVVDSLVPTLPARLVLLLIRVYRAATSWRAPVCRFTPSCSRYAADAVTRHGAGRGAWLAVRRVGRCHPWHPGGHDPVPTSSRRITT